MLLWSGRRCALLLMCGLAALLTAGGQATASTEMRAVPVRYDAVRPNDSLILFVHGLGDSAAAAWKAGSGHRSWPQMVAADESFANTDIFALDYRTEKFCAPFMGSRFANSADELVAAMGRALDGPIKIRNYQRVYIVAHSLGGIVTRQLLLNRPDLSARTRGLFLFGVPTGGSDYANVGLSLGLGCPILKNLTTVAPGRYVDRLQDEWVNRGFLGAIASFCAFETWRRAVGSKGVAQFIRTTVIVSKDSSRSLCSRRIEGIAGDHSEMVKPQNQASANHQMLTRWFREVRGQVPGRPVDAQVAIATCGNEKYGKSLKTSIEQISRGAGASVSRTPTLPLDWTKDYTHYIWSRTPPDVLIIHFSCFRAPGAAVKDEVFAERTKDFAAMLSSLKAERVKVIALSDAFDGNTDPLIFGAREREWLSDPVFVDFKKSGRLATFSMKTYREFANDRGHQAQLAALLRRMLARTDGTRPSAMR